MSSKTTWSLVTGAAVLFALIFFVEHPLREARSRQASRQVLPNLNPAIATNLVIRPWGEMELRFERRNDQWYLSKPINYPADGIRIQTLLQTLAMLEWQERISPEERSEPKSEENYGFKSPQFRLEIQDAHSTHLLEIGTNSAWGDQVFLRPVGSQNIYLTKAELLSLIQHDKNFWRDTSLVNLERIPFEKVKVRTGARSFELQRDDAGLWHMKTLQRRADTSKIEELLKKLQAARVSSFVSEDRQADLEPYGLQSSPLGPELEISFLQNTNTLFALQMGTSPTNQTNMVYVRRQSPANIMLVDKEALRGWQAPFTNFVDCHMISSSPSLIDSIEVVGEDKFTLQQTGNTWQVVGKETFPADPDLMSELLTTFTNAQLEIEKTVVVLESDFARYGLLEPVLQFTLRGASASSGQTNLIAQIQFGRGTNQTDKVFERRTDPSGIGGVPEPSVNSIGADVFEWLPRISWQMQDRRVWSFSSSNVVGITIRQKGSTQKLIRDPDQNWTLAPGSFGMINSVSLEETLHRLGDLKAEWWVSRGDTNLSRFGFEETDHQLTLQINNGGRLQVLNIEFGKTSPDYYPYASTVVNGQRMVFKFPRLLYFDSIKADLMIPPAYRKSNK